MATKTDVKVKTIETIGDVADFLRGLSENDSVLNYPEVAEVCRQIFARVGALDDFEPTDTESLLEVLSGLPQEQLEKELSEEITIDADPVMESRSMNRLETEELLRLEAEGKTNSPKQVEESASKLLGRQTTRDIMNQLYRLRREAELLTKNGVPKERVDEVLVAEAEIREKLPDLEIEKVREAATQLTEVSKSTRNLEAAEQQTRGVLASVGINDKVIIESVADFVEIKIAERITEEFEVALTDKIVGELVTGKGYDPRKVEAIRQAVTENIRHGILNPDDDMAHPQVQLVRDPSVKGGFSVRKGPTLADSLSGVAHDLSGSEIREAVREAENGVEALYSPKRKTQTDAKALVDRKSIQRYRESLFETKVNVAIIVHGEAINNFQTEIQMAREMIFPEGGGETSVKLGQEIRNEGNVVGYFLKSSRSVNENISRAKKLMEVAGDVREIKIIGKVATTIERTPGMKAVVTMVQKAVAFNDKFNALPGQAFSQVGRLLKIESLHSFGEGLLTKYGGTFGAEIASHIGALGLEKGLWNVLTMFVKTGKVGMFTAQTVATTAEVGATTAAAGAAAATGVGIPIALILMAVETIKSRLSQIGDLIQNNVGGVLESLGIVSRDGIRKTKEVVEKVVAGGGVMLGAVVAGILAIPTLIGSGIAAGAATVMAIVFMALIGYNLFQTATTQVASMVAPKPETGGGVCVNTGKPKSGGSGKINCDQTVPDQNGTTVNKANFVRVAEAWRAGGGVNAEACFNDVVKRANEAGKNADYVLWAWLHESGASNYKGFSTAIEDFGIHGQKDVPANDFNAQIDYFLGLDPGLACLGKPGIGNDYWLSFATNYLTGKCDPEAMIGNYNGVLYKAEMEATWGWITSSGMPTTIQGSSGGSSGGSGSPDLNTITDEDGSQLVCEIPKNSTGTNPGNIALPTLDPEALKGITGCPNGWPVQGPITQGPMAKSCSHANMPNAVDFGVMDGTEIHVTHDGVARVGANSIYGNFVDVTGVCVLKDKTRVTFTTRYAHMPGGLKYVTNNQPVKFGKVIGIVDNTGSSTGSHLHYDIRNVSGGAMPDISNTLPGLKHSLTGCCNADNGIMCE